MGLIRILSELKIAQYLAHIWPKHWKYLAADLSTLANDTLKGDWFCLALFLFFFISELKFWNILVGAADPAKCSQSQI